MDVRPAASAEEARSSLAPIWHYFGGVPDDAAWDRFSRVLELDRLHAALEDGRIVGGAGAFSFQLTVPGGRVPAAGVTVVGVLPTHRRRGVLREMMRTQLEDIRRRGEPVAILWASEEPIYTRFGYGLASLCGEVELPRLRSEFRRGFETRGRVRLVELEEALDRFPPVYDRALAQTPGMFARSRDWWDSRRLADPETRREGGGVQVRALLELDGRDAGYALYRLHQSFEGGAANGFLDVLEAVGDSAQATAEIWRFLLDMDWVDRIRARLLPVDHPLLHLLAQPRRLRFRLGDALWLRLVDVEAALAARSYRPGEPVVLEVAPDELCPWNAGCYVIGSDGARRTGAEPELRLTAETLGALYLGGFGFAELARALRVGELAPGALARADALFATDRAPWCPEIF